MYTRTREHGFGAEVKRRIMLGTYVLSAGLLRRVLSEGPAGPHADPARLRRRLRTRRRRRHADQPDAARSGSASASPIRCRCTWRTSSRSARTWPACRRSASRAASRASGLPDRPAADRTAIRRSDAAAASPTPYEQRHRMVEAEAPTRSLSADPSWTALRATTSCSQMRMCDLGAHASTAPSSSSASRRSTPSSTARGLTFRPHYWLSDEWFTPDGVPGVAIPFYLAHPRLAKLELAQMLEVEGGDPESCLRILRHEVGHAIDNAYQLRRRPTRRRLFGKPDDAVSGVLHAEAVQQELRPAPRSLVRAEPSRRGFRRDLRRLARSAVDVGARATPAGRRSGSSSTWTG